MIEASADDPLIGTALGSYELVARIGAGDLGVVYRAYHRLLGQERALKLLPAHLSGDQEYVEPFIREAKLAASLRHPNIVQLHDVGIDERFYYTVMELLPGQSLAELLRVRHRLTPARSLALLAQLAAALDYAHDADVAHHDVKPANIMVGPRDHVTLVDFGIARALDGTQLTSAGRSIGTPAYLAPETILGTGGGITADQYALGVLAYELLVGRLPFPGDDSTAVMEAHAHQPPPSPREIRPELTEALELVLLRQLAKDPDERFPTLIEFIMALRTGLDTRPPRLDLASRAAAGPRPPDPWTSMQIELQEKHRSRQDHPERPTRLSRRRLLATIGTLVVGTGLVAGGRAAWLSMDGLVAASPGQTAEPAPQPTPTTGTPSGAAVPALSALVNAAAVPVPRAAPPVPVILGSGSVLMQGLRMDTMSYYRNAGGNVVAQGILVNPGAEPASIDSFQLAFLSDTGAVVHTAKVVTGPLFVQPRARAPWLQMIGRDLPAFATVKVVVKASSGTGNDGSRSQRFDVTDQVSSGSDDTWTISGRVTYRGKVPTSSVSVLAAAFDGNDRLLRVGSAFASNTHLEPGESALFKVTVDAPTEVARYELVVQGA